ncbi:MAG: FG-GAP repeat domain-containing protein, partial [Armatimonadaceae bacterium]
GRPYGLIQAVDIDNDGFRDAVVVSCQVEEYIGVVRNRGGKAFELVWSRFVENDLPYDTKELRPQVDSVADVDGDGLPELVLGLFNDAGDQKWRTVVIDLLQGWDARKREIPGRYFWGCRDIDGDSVADILVSDEAQRRTGDVTRLAVIDGRTGTERAVLPNAALTIANRPLLRDTAFMASRATPLWIDSGTGSGFLVRTPDGERIWSPLSSPEQTLRPWIIAPLARAAHLASSAQRVTNPERLSKRPGGRSSVALSPLVGRYRGRPELVVVRGDGTVAGGRPVFGKPNVLQGEWSFPGSCPSLWIGPDGRRLVAVFDPKADRFHVYDPSPGQRNPAPVLSVDLPFEPYRIPGMLIPVPGASPQYFVGMKTGVHTTASALYDSAGKLVWRDDLDGPYPRPAGVLGRTANGSEWVEDNHGKIILYGADGSKNVVAHGCHETIPKRGNGAKYVLPISGPFGPRDAFRIVLSPGLEQLEILGRRGERLVMEPYGSIYERQFAASAVARDPSSGWMIGMLTNKGVFHCAGIDDAKDRWKWDSGSKPTYATRVVAGDLDNDGR